MNQAEMAQRVRELIEPLLAQRQAELVELGCHYGGGRFAVRCLVDTAAGITLEELSGLNRSIGAVLDEHDAIPEAYALEVNSPGLDRPLRGAKDFERVMGRRVRVQTLVPVEMKREFAGILLGANDQTILIRTDDDLKHPIRLSDIARAEQEVRW